MGNYPNIHPLSNQSFTFSDWQLLSTCLEAILFILLGFEKPRQKLRACLEVAFGDKKCHFFDETRHFLKFIPLGTDKKSNVVSTKKGCFLGQMVTSKQALSYLKWHLLLYFMLLFPMVSPCQQLQLSRQLVFQEMGRHNANVFLEDSYGFIWIGADGLFKYDGYSIQPYIPRYDDSTQISTGVIYALLEDSKNKIWIGAANGLFRYDRETDQFKRYLMNGPNYQKVNGSVLSLFEDSLGRLWVGDKKYLYVIENPEIDEFRIIKGIELGVRTQGALGFTSIHENKNNELYATSNKGLWLIQNDGSAKQYLPPEWQNVLAEFQILDAVANEDGILWLATTNGLWSFDTVKETFSKKELPTAAGEVMLKILIGPENEIWMGSNGNGLFKLKNGTVEHFTHHSDNPYSLIDNRVKALLVDRFNNLWIGTLIGINCINFEQQKFPFYQIDPGPYRYDNYTFRVMQDSLDGFWFRLLRFGLGYSPGLGEELDILLEPEPSSKGEEVKNFCVDPDGNVWVITLTKGLYKFERGQRKYRPIELGDSMQVAYAHTILSDNQDSRYLWFTSKFGLCRVNRFTFQKKWFYRTDNMPWFENNVMGSLEQSEDGNFWGTVHFQEARQVVYFDYKKEKIFSQVKHQDELDSIKIKITNHIKAVPGNKVWIGTTTGLFIIDATHKTYTHLTEKDGLPVKVVRSITPDLEGNIWFTGPEKICKYDGENYWCYENIYDIERFNTWSAALSKDGRITFGGRNGIYSFYPKDIKFEIDTLRPEIYLTNFKVFNEKRHFGKAYELLKKINLPFKDNVLQFEFSALHFLQPDRIKYRHKLEGFEKNWVETGNEGRQVTYTNLSPGDYTFKVLAANADGFWTTEVKGLQIKLTILPPWYRTWWAYGLYALAGASLLFGIRRYELRWHLARTEARRLKELDAVKTRLYTNITHEFRTPLTIIKGIADRLQRKVDYAIREELKRIQRNGRQLLDLVNQMLDLAKLESGKIPVHQIQDDVIVYLKYLLESHHSLAESKNISLHFQSPVDSLILDFDPGKLRQIVSNLLSNALKFTPKGGRINIVIAELDKQLQIVIEDNGPGIPENQLDMIFNRFYQMDDSATRTSEGTGIGLALTKELVKLLGGKISVESEPGVGSRFIVVLPITKEAGTTLAPEELNRKTHQNDSEYLEDANLPIAIQAKNDQRVLPKLLIIEDNSDVVYYLSIILRSDYTLLTAMDGKAGLETAQRERPCIILCDVMMPEMDGYEVCRRLKENINTSHIPIVLLTAKADFHSHMEGLEQGADAYLAKPFEERALKTCLKTLLENRDRLRQFYTSGAFITRGNSSLSGEGKLGERDQVFFQQLLTVIKANLKDPSFSAEMLSELLHMTYPTCLRKVKAVTGMTINEYIRHIRMHRATQLLADKPTWSITSIGLEVGFNSSAYFSREFKKAMDCSPTAYRKQL